MYQFYNAVNDCTVRAISRATGCSWDEAYQDLSNHARYLGVMPDNVVYIDTYLTNNFTEIYGCKHCNQMTVGEFVEQHPHGTYLITMSGHITCAEDGVIYDTFDPSDRYVWGAYRV